MPVVRKDILNLLLFIFIQAPAGKGGKIDMVLVVEPHYGIAITGAKLIADSLRCNNVIFFVLACHPFIECFSEVYFGPVSATKTSQL